MATHPLTIDPDLQQRLEAVAARQTRSPEFVVREAIEDYLEAHEEQLPVQLTAAERRELDDAIEEYERTGLHITGDEVFAWLAKLKAGERVPPPACHT